MDENDISGSLSVNAPPRSHAAADRWRSIIAEQRESGLGVAAFCAQKSIVTGTFYRWCQKLSDPASLHDQPNHVGTFARVQVIPERSRAGHGAVEVRVHGGRRLVVRPGFQRELLVELIGLLEGMA
jgi:hypothetical protein